MLNVANVKPGDVFTPTNAAELVTMLTAANEAAKIGGYIVLTDASLQGVPDEFLTYKGQTLTSIVPDGATATIRYIERESDKKRFMVTELATELTLPDGKKFRCRFAVSDHLATQLGYQAAVRSINFTVGSRMTKGAAPKEIPIIQDIVLV